MIVAEKDDLMHNQISFERRAKELEEEKREEQADLIRQRNSPFDTFYQVNKKNSAHLRKCLEENPQALKILLFLFDHMDHYNAVMCSYTVFSEVLGISSATITRSIKYLKDNGFIYIYKSGTSNVYVANNDLAWNSWGTNVKYCKFPTNIVLSSSEQENMDVDVEIKPVKQRIIKTEVKGRRKNSDKKGQQAN